MATQQEVENLMNEMEIEDPNLRQYIQDTRESWPEDKSAVFVVGKGQAGYYANQSKNNQGLRLGRKSNSNKKTATPQEYWYLGLEQAVEALNDGRRYPVIPSSLEETYYAVSVSNIHDRAWDLLKLYSACSRCYILNGLEEGNSWLRPFYNLNDLWEIVKKMGAQKGGELIKCLHKSGADWANKAKAEDFEMEDIMKALPDNMLPDYSWKPTSKSSSPKFKEKIVLAEDKNEDDDFGLGYVRGEFE